MFHEYDSFLTKSINDLFFPVIFVIGCTGTGKSDLGVSISKKYDGEVISVDSMQFYKGLDIATNKITEEEAEGVPHHMMSFLEPSTTSKYNVHKFRETALQLIEDIRARNRIPVIVGGTTYYAESLLYEDNLVDASGNDDSDPDEMINESVSNQELWDQLNSCDPETAKILHPNNRYRIWNAIRIFKTTGRRKSEIIREQKRNENIDLGGRLRFHNSLVLYLDASPEVLDERLDSRVEKMIRMGLKNELVDFYNLHNQFISNNFYGVMQCIGLKEFVPWLEMKAEERNSEKGEEIFKMGCEDVKLHTRQYARRQRRWYQSRLLRRSHGDRRMASTKMLDTSNKLTILSNGIEIVDEWMNGIDMFEKIPVETKVVQGVDANMLIRCELCDMTISGKENWEKHEKGKKHKYNLRKDKSNLEVQ